MFSVKAPFQCGILLAETSYNQASRAVLEAFEVGWTSWAGLPEFGVFTDRAKHCGVRMCLRSSKAFPLAIGTGGKTWFQAILKKMIWSEQLAGREQMLDATLANQWVLGRSIRPPADLTDDSEAVRLGALALSTTPSSRFFLKSKLRFAAKPFVKVSNSEALKRAELRRVRPSRGPFLRCLIRELTARTCLLETGCPNDRS